MGIIEVEYKGERYRAFPTGTVKVWYSHFGESGWDILTIHQVETIRAVQSLARQTEEGKRWGPISEQALRRPFASPFEGGVGRRHKPVRYNNLRRMSFR